jgi:hypothetical protein
LLLIFAAIYEKENNKSDICKKHLRKFGGYLLKSLLKIILFPLKISFITMFIVYAVYALYHFGFGRITIPEWYTNYDSKGFPEPFPVQKAIQYWNHKGQILSLNFGIITFVGTYLFIVIKSQLTIKFSE